MVQWTSLLLLAALAVAAVSSPVKPERSPPTFPSPSHRLHFPPKASMSRDGRRGVRPLLGRPVGIDEAEPRRLYRPRVPAAVTTSPTRADADPYRLPGDIVPTFYHLFISVDFDKRAFIGKVEINVNVLKDTNIVVLHAAKNLQWTQDVLVERMHAPDGDKVVTYSVTTAARDPDHQTVTLTLDAPLQAGQHYKITFPEFSSPLNTDFRGFYLLTYTDKGEERLMAATQFEPTHAREAFPSFDEPGFKARFQVDIGHKTLFTVRANMPALPGSPAEDGAELTQFETTVPMPTYLLAWAVSDFEHLSNADGSFSTWARSDSIQGADISQDVGPKALAELATYTGIPFALPKMDQFAIPDEDLNAMENWGLVTYGEPLLIRTEHTDVRHEQQIRSVICHELSHQWTGNLVTLDWWSHTWLNEGFATFFENFICDKINPELKLQDKAITTYAEEAMQGDLLDNQHAMSSDVSTFEQIESKFDTISYSKGGTVLRMFQHILTPDVFQKGIQRYLASNKFKNAHPDHLFRALSAEATLANYGDAKVVSLPDQVDFITVAKSWTDQPGVPLVTVERDDEEKTIKLTQKQFRLPTSSAASEDRKWYIPISLVTGKAADFSKATTVVWLTPDQPTVTIPLDVDDVDHQWVLVNPQQTGYFRVHYDEANWNRLLFALVTPDDYFGASIPAATRAQIFNDMMALVQTGHIPWDIMPVSMITALVKEREASVWLAAHYMILTLSDRLAHTDVWPSFQIILKSAAEEAYKSVGLAVAADDGHDRRHLRYYVVAYSCASGNVDCLNDAARMLNDWLTDPDKNKIHADTSVATMCYGIQGSPDETFQKVKNLWSQATGMPRSDYARALLCTKNEVLLTGFLNEILAKSVTEGNAADDVGDVLYLLTTSHPTHHRFFLDYVKANWEKIDSFFKASDPAETTSSTGLVEVLVNIISSIRSDAEYQELLTWVTATFEHRADFSYLTAALAATDKALDAWFRKEYDAVARYIYMSTGTTPPVPISTSAAPPATTQGSTTPVSTAAPGSTAAPPRTTSPPGHTTAAPTSTPKSTPSSASLATAASATLLLALLWAPLSWN